MATSPTIPSLNNAARCQILAEWRWMRIFCLRHLIKYLIQENALQSFAMLLDSKTWKFDSFVFVFVKTNIFWTLNSLLGSRIGISSSVVSSLWLPLVLELLPMVLVCSSSAKGRIGSLHTILIIHCNLIFSTNKSIFSCLLACLCMADSVFLLSSLLMCPVAFNIYNNFFLMIYPIFDCLSHVSLSSSVFFTLGITIERYRVLKLIKNLSRKKESKKSVNTVWSFSWKQCTRLWAWRTTTTTGMLELVWSVWCCSTSLQHSSSLSSSTFPRSLRSHLLDINWRRFIPTSLSSCSTRYRLTLARLKIKTFLRFSRSSTLSSAQLFFLWSSWLFSTS